MQRLLVNQLHTTGRRGGPAGELNKPNLKRKMGNSVVGIMHETLTQSNRFAVARS